MNISATFHRRALVSAFVLIAATAGNAFAADPAKPQFTDPLKELVGKWHGIHEKVVYEVKPNGEVVVVENNSESGAVKNAKFAPGIVISTLQYKKFEHGQYYFTGKCWTRGGGKPDFWLQPCTETGMAYYETRGKKPYWKLVAGGWGMLRKENLGGGGQGRK
jgi:hypothetical protein